MQTIIILKFFGSSFSFVVLVLVLLIAVANTDVILKVI